MSAKYSLSTTSLSMPFTSRSHHCAFALSSQSRANHGGLRTTLSDGPPGWGPMMSEMRV